MPRHAAARQQSGHRAARWLAWLWAAFMLLAAQAARAQGVEVLALAATRSNEAVALEYQLRVTLPRAAEEAVQRGVPLYFTAQATLWRNRWYWRDERVARERREWRVSYQPLTSSWRVSQGGLGQSYTSQVEAMAAISKSAGWRIADGAAVDGDSRYYVEFNWRLDTTQLPRPLQIGLTGVGGAGDWTLGVERSIKLAAADAK
jgi:hypothetical protein